MKTSSPNLDETALLMQQRLQSGYAVDRPNLQILVFDDEKEHWFAFQKEMHEKRLESPWSFRRIFRPHEQLAATFKTARCPQVKRTASRVISLQLDSSTDFYSGPETVGLRERFQPRTWRFYAVFCQVKQKEETSSESLVTPGQGPPHPERNSPVASYLASI
ncbi:unnamed protein product [Amoebophrya sp. A120]|nr:unnamed protein product [Amoebophrya sp. A120]|eukprot:GSA120T00003943001.1